MLRLSAIFYQNIDSPSITAFAAATGSGHNGLFCGKIIDKLITCHNIIIAL